MQDRVSLYPGRVKLEPVAGQANLYDLTRADQPTQEGTPLNKANLLSDATETAMFGAAANRTVDEAFAGLAVQIKLIMSNTAAITLTLKDSAGHAIPGVLVQGILTESGQAVYSGTDGVAAGHIAEGSQTIKVTGYADIEDYTETIAVTKGTTITKALTLTTRNFFKITSSKSVKFSGNVNTVDVTVVGGGGGGGGGAASNSNAGQIGGNGGGGGYCVAQAGQQVSPNVAYPAIIGAGGNGGAAAPYEWEGTSGGNGGSTSFLGITANGGNGATANSVDSTPIAASGNGSGGRASYKWSGTYTSVPTSGSPGTVQGYASFDSTALYGGGGGGGAGNGNGNSGAGATGGSQYGGNGGDWDGDIDGKSAQNNTGGGGGGGGANRNNDDCEAGKGGSGGSGVVTIRMHLKSAA